LSRTVGTDAEETDEPPPQNEEFLLELWRASEELDPPPQKTSEWVGEFDEGGEATEIEGGGAGGVGTVVLPPIKTASIGSATGGAEGKGANGITAGAGAAKEAKGTTAGAGTGTKGIAAGAGTKGTAVGAGAAGGVIQKDMITSEAEEPKRSS
jgi:hypothetical protein